jgi:hypothetical protein
VQVTLDQVGVLGRGGVEIGEDHASGGQVGVEMGHHHVGVVLDLQPSPATDLAGGRQDLLGHPVEVLSPSAGRVRRERQIELGQVGVTPLLGFLRRGRERLELVEGAAAQVPGEPGNLGQARQGAFVEGGHRSR